MSGAEVAAKFNSFEVDPAQAAEYQTPLVMYWGGEFLDTAVPDIRWIIPGLLPAGVPMVLASKGGLGKSWVMLQLTIALACGKPFLDFEPQAPMGAIYFGLEDGKETVHRRVRTIVDAYRAAGQWSAEDEAAFRLHFVCPFVNWETRGATTYLPDLMPTLGSLLEFMSGKGVHPGVMVLDTLARFSEGDENTVAALRPILAACNRIAHAGYTPVMLHHVGKGQDGAKTKDKPSLSDRMSTEWVRGSSAIVDNFRGVLQMVAIREDEADRAGLDIDKARTGGYMVLGATKMNGASRAEHRFLEQHENGSWYAPADGAESLARLRGPKALAALSKQMALLVDLWHGTRYGQEPDKKGLSLKHCGEAKDPQTAFRSLIRQLRNAGLVSKNSYVLTLSGLERVRSVNGDTDRVVNNG